MNLLITVSFCLMLSALLYFITGRKLELKNRKIWLGSMIVVLLLATSIMFFAQKELDNYQAYRAWLPTPARVISAQVVGKRAFRPEIIYTYTVNGFSVTDTTDMEVPGFGSKSNRFNVARNEVASVREDSTFVVYYNPANVVEHLSHIRPPHTIYIMYSTGGCFFIAGTYIFLVGLFQTKKNKLD